MAGGQQQHMGWMEVKEVSGGFVQLCTQETMHGRRPTTDDNEVEDEFLWQRFL
jgi:hypothetical protein